MKILYDSQHYYVAEFPGHDGIELVDKVVGRSGFLEGEVVARFRTLMMDQISEDPTDEAVDEFLGCYGALLTQRVVLH